MRKVTLVLAALAGLGLAVGSIIVADDSQQPKPPKDLFGKITKAVDDKGVIEVTPPPKPGEEPKPIKVATDDKTVVKIDDKDAKVSDLKVSLFVRITPAEGTAQMIDAKTKLPESRPAGDMPKGGDLPPNGAPKGGDAPKGNTPPPPPPPPKAGH